MIFHIICHVVLGLVWRDCEQVFYPHLSPGGSRELVFSFLQQSIQFGIGGVVHKECCFNFHVHRDVSLGWWLLLCFGAQGFLFFVQCCLCGFVVVGALGVSVLSLWCCCCCFSLCTGGFLCCYLVLGGVFSLDIPQLFSFLICSFTPPLLLVNQFCVAPLFTLILPTTFLSHILFSLGPPWSWILNFLK